MATPIRRSPSRFAVHSSASTVTRAPGTRTPATATSAACRWMSRSSGATETTSPLAGEPPTTGLPGLSSRRRPAPTARVAASGRGRTRRVSAGSCNRTGVKIGSASADEPSMVRQAASARSDGRSQAALVGEVTGRPEALGDLVPYEALHIYEANEDRRELVPLLARSNEYEEEIMRSRPRFGEGITGWAVENRRPVWTNRAHLDPRSVNVPGTPVEPEAMISMPLIARGALKGALNIYRIGEDAGFAEHEFELAKRFGDAAALALDNAQIRARLELAAQTDSLTGLYNHRYFHERLRSELTRASRLHDTVAVILFDLDDFKRVNDIHG